MAEDLDIETVQNQVERFLTDTEQARELSEKCRDYYDHKQWTEAEAAKLRARNQAPIVVNRVRPKVRGLVGLYNMRESDPKAFPRTRKHEDSAHAITDALRYVADNNDFSDTRLGVADEFFVEGYGGAAVVIRQKKNGEIECDINQIPWDRIYFDPHSRRLDFKDARYLGFYMWMYAEEAKEKFPEADVDELIASSNYYTDETTEDRPRWTDKERNRIRVAVHFCIHNAQWYMSVFSENTFLMGPVISPYQDEEGEPTCPIELVSANIDRNNQRYGEVAGFLDQQDEINHRRSKFLHLVNQRQTFGRKGAVDDVSKLKRELAKPDGHIEFQGEEWNKDFGVIPTNTQIQGQVDLYQDAKSELDAISFNSQLSGERSEGARELSGRAIERLQDAGTTELNQDYARLQDWEKRIYRQIWARVKQYWTEEKWIRVTDDRDTLRWVGLNTQVTAREFLETKIQDESLPIPQRKKYEAAYQHLTQLEGQTENMQMAEQAAAQLEQPVATKNPVPELDVDIILDQSFDTVNVQQEQFQMLAQFASNADIDITELIELSQLRGKDELIEKINKRRQGQAQTAEELQQLEAQERQASTMHEIAEAKKTQAETEHVTAQTALTQTEQQQKELENLLIMNDPDKTSVSV